MESVLLTDGCCAILWLSDLDVANSRRVCAVRMVNSFVIIDMPYEGDDNTTDEFDEQLNNVEHL